MPVVKIVDGQLAGQKTKNMPPALKVQHGKMFTRIISVRDTKQSKHKRDHRYGREHNLPFMANNQMARIPHQVAGYIL